jgi:hypothetical protein
MPITINGDTGISSEGLELVATQTWDNTAVSSVDFTHDATKYTSYFVTWWIDHSPSWSQTYLRFRNSSGAIATGYSTTTEWHASGVGSTPVWNNMAGNGNQGGVWLAGNGNDFDSQGMCLVSIPNSDNYPAVKSVATLAPSVPNGDQSSYLEQSSGELKVNGSTITGFRIYGSSGFANRGTINVMGVKRL